MTADQNRYFRIASKAGVDHGVWAGSSPEAALRAMAVDAGGEYGSESVRTEAEWDVTELEFPLLLHVKSRDDDRGDPLIVWEGGSGDLLATFGLREMFAAPAVDAADYVAASLSDLYAQIDRDGFDVVD